MRIRIGASLLVFVLAACHQASGDVRPARDAATARPPSALISAASPRPASIFSESREFRDWQAVCDNGNACFAFGFAPDFASGWIRVSMPAGPDAEPEIAFGLWAEQGAEGEKGTGPASASLVVDGRTFAGVLIEPSDAVDPVAEIRSGVRAAVTALAAAQSLEIRIGDSASISTTGASAALLWIDERQGRLDTTTALVRRGDQPASRVPAATALPVRSAAPAVDQSGLGDGKQTIPAALRALQVVQECLNDVGDSEWIQNKIMSARLDARRELWGVPCDFGAYNVTHQWFVTGPGGQAPRPVELIGRDGPRTGDEAELWPDNGTVNGRYDPRSRTLTSFAMGRGVGDCGTHQTWLWTGRSFELQREEAMSHCAGVPIDFWPTTWRTR